VIPERRTVGVVPSPKLVRALPMMSLLLEASGMGVEILSPEDDAGRMTGVIYDMPGGGGGVRVPACAASICLVWASAVGESSEIRFRLGGDVPEVLRGRRVRSMAPQGCDISRYGGDPLALSGDCALWKRLSLPEQRHEAFCTSLEAWSEARCLFDLVNSRRFMCILPLINWLRALSDWDEWQRPTLHGAFIFDDPNLHAARYGFVRFPEIAASAKENNFHVAFGTVPLDGYYASRKAASVFRSWEDAISLCVHGNNHTRRELGGSLPGAGRLALMRQALHRVESLERRTGLRVSRCMVPPHGACAEATLPALVDAGFLCASVSHGSLHAENPAAEWTARLGPASSVVIGGLPIMPRFPLGDQAAVSALLAAYLGQPILPMGHHGDVESGLGPLVELADYINSLGKVKWACLDDVSCSLHALRVVGRTVWVRLVARRARFSVPQGSSELRVVAPWLDSRQDEVWMHEVGLASRPVILQRLADGSFCGVLRSANIEVVVVRTGIGDSRGGKAPRTAYSAIARRLAAEARDRVLPWLPPFLRGFLRS